MTASTLDTAHAAALAELLQFLRDWINDDDQLNTSLTNFINDNDYNPDYSLDHLRAELSLFAALVNTTDDKAAF